MMPECTECNTPGPGCALHVYGTIKDEHHEAACVALLECALETQRARAHSDIFARQERADQKRKEELEEEATRFRKNTALVFALRLVRKDLSQNQLRNFISEQNAQGINTMSGRRIFPSFDGVIAIYRVEVDNSPTGDWDAEEEPSESEEDEPMILEYVHSEEHNIVAYVHHAAITTCEINGEELRADQTKRWSVGDQVEGLYAVAQRRRWYFASVVAITGNGETYTLQYEYVPDDSSSGQATVEGVVATQIRKRPGRMRGNTRKDDEMTTIACKTTCKAQQGQVNKSAVTLGLVCAQANGAVQLAPLWLVQDVSADDAYRVVPDLPTLSVPHAAIVSGMHREPIHDFERLHRVVPFAVYEIALDVVSGIEDLAALRAT